MPTFIIRKARHDDYQAVIELGVYYTGFDYIPYFYHQYINDPDYLCYVGEENGKIVGFLCGLIHDGGRTLQPRAGRVAEGYRGKGYSLAKLNRMFTEASSTGVKELIYSKTTVNWPDIHLSFRRVDVMKDVYFTIPRPDIKHTRPLMCLDKAHFETILDCPAAVQTLFPRGLLYVHFLALGLDKSNIRHIINEDTSVFAKLSSEGDAAANEFRPENIRSLSVGLRFPAAIGDLCEIIFQGKFVEDLDDHITSQIGEMGECKTITVGLYVPLTFSINVLEEKIMKIFSDKSRNKGNMLTNKFIYIFKGSMATATHVSKY